MADRNTKIKGVQIADAVAGSGLAKDASGNIKINLETVNPGLAITDNKLDVKLKANDGLTKGADGVSVDYDNSTIGIVGNKLAYIGSSVVTGDIIMEDKSATCNGVEDEFVLANTPVANSVQVYLNGLLQEAGSAKDYTLATATITFVIPPETGDILVIHYVKS